MFINLIILLDDSSTSCNDTGEATTVFVDVLGCSNFFLPILCPLHPEYLEYYFSKYDQSGIYTCLTPYILISCRSVMKKLYRKKVAKYFSFFVLSSFSRFNGRWIGYDRFIK